jgi:hypothetical protein
VLSRFFIAAYEYFDRRYGDFRETTKRNQRIGAYAPQNSVEFTEIVNASLVTLKKGEVGNLSSTATAEVNHLRFWSE